VAAVPVLDGFLAQVAAGFLALDVLVAVRLGEGLLE